jgi:hypothetical protein
LIHQDTLHAQSRISTPVSTSTPISSRGSIPTHPADGEDRRSRNMNNAHVIYAWQFRSMLPRAGRVGSWKPYP